MVLLRDDRLDTVMTKLTSVTLTLRRGLQLLRAFRGDRYPLTGAELALKQVCRVRAYRA